MTNHVALGLKSAELGRLSRVRPIWTTKISPWSAARRTNYAASGFELNSDGAQVEDPRVPAEW